MKTTKSIGDYGENIAKLFLEEKGHTILEVNYRFKKGEVDIITSFENTLIFVEVKFRSSSAFGFPEEVVNETKINLIQKVAEYYIEKKNWNKNIRFDIISIIERNNNRQIEHFEDAF